MVKKGISYFLVSLLILTYVLSYVGFAIHKCTCNGSTDVMLLIGNISCERLHAHICLYSDTGHKDCQDNHAHHECTSNHSDGCCSTDVMVLTSDQDVQDLPTISVPVSDLDLSLFFLENITTEIARFELLAFLKETPPLVGDKGVMPVISQWRL